MTWKSTVQYYIELVEGRQDHLKTDRRNHNERSTKNTITISKKKNDICMFYVTLRVSSSLI